MDLGEALHALTDFLSHAFDRDGVIVRKLPVQYAVGGTTKLAIQTSSFGLGPTQDLARWHSGDGSSKAVTVIVTAPSGAFPRQGVGAYAKIRIGDQRGAVYQWMPVPGIATFVARDVSVQGLLGGAPYKMVQDPASGLVTPRPFNTDGIEIDASITCLIREGTPADDPPVGVLIANQPLGSAVPVVTLPGPVFITSIELNNQSSDAVAVVWGETNLGGALFGSLVLGSVIVPAGASVGVSADMIGPIAYCLGIAAVADLTDPTSFDPNGDDVTVNVSGFYVPTM